MFGEDIYMGQKDQDRFYAEYTNLRQARSKVQKIPHTGQRYSDLRTSDRFDDPLAYPGFGLGENVIFPKYELKLYFLVKHNF